MVKGFALRTFFPFQAFAGAAHTDRSAAGLIFTELSRQYRAYISPPEKRTNDYLNA